MYPPLRNGFLLPGCWAELTLIYCGGSDSSGVFTSWTEPVFPFVFLAMRGGPPVNHVRTVHFSSPDGFSCLSTAWNSASRLSGGITHTAACDPCCQSEGGFPVRSSLWSCLPSCDLFTPAAKVLLAHSSSPVPMVSHNFSSLSCLGLTSWSPADSEGAAYLVQRVMNEWETIHVSLDPRQQEIDMFCL